MATRLWPGLVAALAIAFLTFMVYAAGAESGRQEGALAMSQLQERLNSARAQAAETEIKHQRAIAAEIDRMNQNHDQAMAQMQHNAASDRIATDGLRSELAAVKDRLRRGQDSATEAGQSVIHASRAAMVLSDMLSSCSAEREELAGTVDEAGLKLRTIREQVELIRGQ